MDDVKAHLLDQKNKRDSFSFFSKHVEKKQKKLFCGVIAVDKNILSLGPYQG